MQFNSLTFALFLCPALLSYYLAPKAYRWLPLVIASYLFYAATDALHIGVLVGLTLFSYWVALRLEHEETPQRRRGLLWTGLVPILIALVGFRLLALLLPGSNFFSIPLGLSFFALRLASYLVDVSNRATNAERHVGTFSVYVAVFPELPAGPIDRAGALLPQLRAPSDFRYGHFTSGVKLFAWGLFKKLVIADRLRLFVNAAYDSSGSADGAAYCVATLYFAFQIYCDFSGYSDMAIGLGEMFGLKFAKNFDRPYLSKSIAEFWTRWHISFSSWLRDYVFLPLVYKTGRVLDGRLPHVISDDKLGYAVAAVTTMALAGLWHGASMHFVAWGVVIAVFMVVSVLTRKLRARLGRLLYGPKLRRVHDAARIGMTFFLVNVSWVFFRADSVGDAVGVLSSIPGGLVSYLSHWFQGFASGHFRGTGLAAPFSLGQGGFEALLAVSGVGILLVVELLQQGGSIREKIGGYPIWIRWPLYVTLVLAIVVFRASAGTKFIYAGF